MELPLQSPAVLRSRRPSIFADAGAIRPSKCKTGETACGCPDNDTVVCCEGGDYCCCVGSWGDPECRDEECNP
jgi:hypothetical protein